MVRSMFTAFCMLMVWSGAGKADPSSATYLLSPGDVVMVGETLAESYPCRQQNALFHRSAIAKPSPEKGD